MEIIKETSEMIELLNKKKIHTEKDLSAATSTLKDFLHYKE